MNFKLFAILIFFNFVTSFDSMHFLVNVKDNIRSSPSENEINDIRTKYLKFMRNFEQIYEKFNENRKYVTQNTNSSNSQCQDPNEEFMILKHLSLIHYFKEFIGILNLKEVSSIFEDIIMKNDAEHVNVETKNLTDCASRVHGLKPIGLCNSQNYLHWRENMYPAIRNQVKCLCDKCLTLKQHDLQFRCTPIKMIMPALIRNQKNCIDGIYDWKPTLEYVSIACECLPVQI